MNASSSLPVGGPNYQPNSVIPDPGQAAQFEKVHLQKEIDKLKETLFQTSAKAAQAVLRDHWRDFIFTNFDENHISFLLHTILTYTSTLVLNKVFQDGGLYKSKICDFLCGKEQMLIRVFQSATHDQITSFVPEDVLNKVLAERVKYVPARDLINWLACADRLGYKPDDILDDKDESVIPNEMAQGSHNIFQVGQAVESPTEAYRQEIFSAEQRKNVIVPLDHSNNASSKEQPNQNFTENQAISKQNYKSQEHSRQHDQSRQFLNSNLPSPAAPDFSSSHAGITSSFQPVKNSPNYFCPNCKMGFSQKALYEHHVQTKKECWNPVAASITPQINVSQAPLPSSIRTSDRPLSWSSSGSSQFLPLPTQQSIKDSQSRPSQRSIAGSQRNIPSQQSLENFANNIPNPQYISSLNIQGSNRYVTQNNSTVIQLSPTPPLTSSGFTNSNNGSKPPSINSSNLGNSSENLISLQNQLKNIDENLKKEIACIPLGIPDDQRKARIDALIRSTSQRKQEIGRSYSSHFGIPHSSEAVRDTQIVKSNSQVVCPTSNGVTSTCAQINPSTTESSTSSATEPGGIQSFHRNYGIEGADRNSNSGHLRSNSQLNSPTCSNKHQSNNGNINDRAKRLRSEDYCTNPRAAGPYQPFNGQAGIQNNGEKTNSINSSVDSLPHSVKSSS